MPGQRHAAVDARERGRADYDGAKRRKRSKVRIAVDTLGHLMALKVSPAHEGDCAQVVALTEEVRHVSGNTVNLAYVDQGYIGPNAAEAVQQHGILLQVVKHPMAKRGFVLLPRRWVVERLRLRPVVSGESPGTKNVSTPASKASTPAHLPAS